jgi:hypothetical protein
MILTVLACHYNRWGHSAGQDMVGTARQQLGTSLCQNRRGRSPRSEAHECHMNPLHFKNRSSWHHVIAYHAMCESTARITYINLYMYIMQCTDAYLYMSSVRKPPAYAPSFHHCDYHRFVLSLQVSLSCFSTIDCWTNNILFRTKHDGRPCIVSRSRPTVWPFWTQIPEPSHAKQSCEVRTKEHGGLCEKFPRQQNTGNGLRGVYAKCLCTIFCIFVRICQSQRLW